MLLQVGKVQKVRFGIFWVCEGALGKFPSAMRLLGAQRTLDQLRLARPPVLAITIGLIKLESVYDFG